MVGPHPLPWLVPGTIAFAVIGLFVSRPLARRLGTHAAVAWLLVVSLAAIGFATLAPLYGVFEPSAAGAGQCDLSNLGLVPLHELLHRNDRSLNVVLFVPLGVALGLLPRSRRTTVLILGAVATPFVIETTQLLLPTLHRGCQGIDVIDNLTGLVLGLLAGALLGAFLRALGATVDRVPDVDALPR